VHFQKAIRPICWSSPYAIIKIASDRAIVHKGGPDRERKSNRPEKDRRTWQGSKVAGQIPGAPQVMAGPWK
jgi:hypothetical protein